MVSYPVATRKNAKLKPANQIVRKRKCYEKMLTNQRRDNAAKYFKKLSEGSHDQSLEGLLSESLNNWISFLDVNNERAIELIDSINPRFENIKKIQRTFSYCFYGSKLANKEFKKLTSNAKTNFARYHFFHANFLYQSGNKKNSLKGIVFIDFKVCILILLSKLNSNGNESPIGDAVAILPAKVPTFRI